MMMHVHALRAPRGGLPRALPLLSRAQRAQRWMSSERGGDGARLSGAQTVSAVGIGAGAGLLGSLVGMGGAFIALPFLTAPGPVLGLALPQHVAHATSLFAVMATGSMGAVGYMQGGRVRWKDAAMLAATGAVMATVGTRVAAALPAHRLKMALGVFMVCIAPTVPLKPAIMRWVEEHRNGGTPPPMIELQATAPATAGAATMATTMEKDLMSMAAIGVASGFLAGVFGVGGGAITVPAVTLATDMSHHEALGTSLAAMVPMALAGTISNVRQKTLSLRAGIPLGIGTCVGALLGSKIALDVDADKLRWLFMGLMLVLGLHTLRGAHRLRAAASLATSAPAKQSSNAAFLRGNSSSSSSNSNSKHMGLKTTARTVNTPGNKTDPPSSQ